MNSKKPAERPKPERDAMKSTPKPKQIDPKLLRFPATRAANTKPDLEDMWDNLPV